MSGISQFPLLDQLNKTRTEIFQERCDSSCLSEKTTAWIAHKAYTVVCMPTNILAAGFGLAAMAVTASTLGVLKIALFAASLGNIKPEFPIGFIWIGERAVSSVFNTTFNVYEIGYDLVDGLYQGYSFSCSVAKKLGMDHLIKKVFHSLGEFFSFIFKRVEKGIIKAEKSEQKLNGDFGDTLDLIKPLEDLTSETRIDSDFSNRTFSKILQHSLLSLINIPVNLLVATTSSVAASFFSSVFIGKTLLYAAANIDLQIPTLAARCGSITAGSMANIAKDGLQDGADVFISIYKISKASGLIKVLGSMKDLLLYIPKAILS
jgi:hypothetical protein